MWIKRKSAARKSDVDGRGLSGLEDVNDLDEFVAAKLEELASRLSGQDRDIPRRAREEYKTWLTEGYGSGELGVRRGPGGNLL